VWRCKKNYKHFKCGDCGKQFSAKVGTIFEKSLLPMRKWFMAIFLITSSKKGIASLQLAHQIDVTQKTAWFMLQRIRHMMSQKNGWIQLCDIVEADEVYIGGYPKKGDRKKDENGKFLEKRGAGTKKPIVFGMVQRGGNVIAIPIKERDRNTLHAMVKLNLTPGSTLVTDDLNAYWGLGESFEHRTINHTEGKYSDKQGTHTNTIEGF
jgi:transposase-like protein